MLDISLMKMEWDSRMGLKFSSKFEKQIEWITKVFLVVDCGA